MTVRANATFPAPIAVMRLALHAAQITARMAVTAPVHVYVPKVVPMAVMQAANNAVMKNVKTDAS